MRYNNKGKFTGSKKNGHVANSIQKPLTSQLPINKYINKVNELLKEIIIDFSEVMNDHLSSKGEISTDPNTLSDEFLKKHLVP